MCQWYWVICLSSAKQARQESDFFGVKRLPFKAITRKPVVATPEENAKNPRATSAKLRIAERSEHEWNLNE